VPQRERPPKGSFVTTDGVRLHYLERGTGRPVVFLHGNGAMVEDMLIGGVIDHAAREYRAIAFDICMALRTSASLLRGVGTSFSLSKMIGSAGPGSRSNFAMNAVRSASITSRICGNILVSSAWPLLFPCKFGLASPLSASTLRHRSPVSRQTIARREPSVWAERCESYHVTGIARL
jgi:hypothetical protein